MPVAAFIPSLEPVQSYQKCPSCLDALQTTFVVESLPGKSLAKNAVLNTDGERRRSSVYAKTLFGLLVWAATRKRC